MEQIELKTIGELIDELTIINIRIWHKIDQGLAGDNHAAVEAQQFNSRRSALMRAINGRLEPGGMQIPVKEHSAQEV